ncbi:MULTISPECIES: LacI family DNA-binding transcriptional regulator [Paraburkholderia]|uniref:Transcriptional regulator, LacI family n=1 Tax=Paraburkholderia phenazinium TaxID=60549 RepID=A0A1N6GFE0_9BURK|nr:LacI family DNA-binding transcriptional regulator [Paraburkholderia phenazinium]SIO06268.1 transcriptional regulator, LacI family [Paraburkholderia phenazinium]
MSSPHTIAPRRATISDVAREAGTGKTSISRYLNGELSVLSPELRARIEAAIERLDYQPNQMARGLKRGRNRLIGMLIADLTNPYSVEVLQGVEAACHALGYMPLICHAANEVEMERRYLQLLTTYRVEGVIVNALGVRDETLRPVGDGGIPAVLVDRMVDGLVADLVGLDNTAAVQLGTRHLLERGFDDIWFVVQPFERISSRRLREEAFRAAIDAQSRARGQTVVLELGDAAAVEGALAELDKELDRALADAPDRATWATHVTQAAAAPAPRIALFAANGPVALCLARHLNARYGMRWQERIALLSIDDPEWAEFAGITAIRQPTYQIGYRAVEFLHERIDGVQTAVRDCLLPGELIVRESTSR